MHAFMSYAKLCGAVSESSMAAVSIAGHVSVRRARGERLEARLEIQGQMRVSRVKITCFGPGAARDGSASLPSPCPCAVSLPNIGAGWGLKRKQRSKSKRQQAKHNAGSLGRVVLREPSWLGSVRCAVCAAAGLWSADASARGAWDEPVGSTERRGATRGGMATTPIERVGGRGQGRSGRLSRRSIRSLEFGGRVR